MKIAIVGTGYVGLVTGTCFAETGNTVICVDIDQEKVKKMQSGVVPIYEPHLDMLFERNIKQGRLFFTSHLEEAVTQSDIIFLALPTPPGEDGSADLSYILGVANQLGKIMKSYKVIVDKSTVPVGTSEKVKNEISKNTPYEFDVVSNPEFLREGFAVDDFMKPDRVVIGTQSEKAKKIMETLYKPYVRQGNPIIFMDEKSAELTKYAANAFLATKITFMNEIANFCEKVGANVDMVRIGIGSDSRIGKRFLFPGVGYGGSCFPKDVQALSKSGKENNYPFQILEAVMAVNENQKTILLPKIKKYFEENLAGKKIALWGLAFKPDTDDIREAPSLYIINGLLEAGATVSAFDPEAMQNVQNILSNQIEFAPTHYDALKNADALIIVTEWPLFRTPDFDKMKLLMKNPVIFDGRNIYDLDTMKENGFYYSSIGRKTIEK
ncbi:MAG: UDP-glucose/GDP-mannose dehydrogenase family protein [Bacteroidetes bacterium]|nr:UDP-glucose/GDP-mannose dehydrogenase family protein [Bacteroidota bacterium]MBV6462233.1 UDP-glucose 6-dehydrogenase TuaD [Flavobacteriales bacterium]WKZ74817.1 MAG: UDP-glucose/GDP-mannose dehydrogenase family protein [Vicingaceae bacterium]MCL4816039.1 UDP-glucose/GDP-mannose dehydrogenase family protein [Flavobacteriales bacterium]NOG95198.1 UDP-glucose/GDP-mannose dehydrogenase family protein [Bacteroidota bacterium]